MKLYHVLNLTDRYKLRPNFCRSWEEAIFRKIMSPGIGPQIKEVGFYAKCSESHFKRIMDIWRNPVIIDVPKTNIFIRICRWAHQKKCDIKLLDIFKAIVREAVQKCSPSERKTILRSCRNDLLRNYVLKLSAEFQAAFLFKII